MSAVIEIDPFERHENGVWVRTREEDDPLALDAGKVAA